MNEHIDTPIPLKDTKGLSTVWHFTKECGEYITRLVKHKVCSVSETRSGGIISWRGCLDNDEYFLLIVIDGEYYIITINDVPFAKVILEVNEETTKMVQEVLNALNKFYDN